MAELVCQFTHAGPLLTVLHCVLDGRDTLWGEEQSSQLTKLGAVVAEGPDWLRITPPDHLGPATIDTYDDHRVAMCFSLAALGGVPVRINDPGCVRKTFPGYFDEFARLAR